MEHKPNETNNRNRTIVSLKAVVALSLLATGSTPEVGEIQPVTENVEFALDSPDTSGDIAIHFDDGFPVKYTDAVEVTALDNTNPTVLGIQQDATEAYEIGEPEVPSVTVPDTQVTPTTVDEAKKYPVTSTVDSTITTVAVAPSTTSTTELAVDETADTSTTIAEIEHDVTEIPMDIQRQLALDTVYLENNGCSGMLIRNSEGVAIGAVTAEHCRLRAVDRPRFTDESGAYIEVDNTIHAMTGDGLLTAESIGLVEKVILPAADDITTDYAVLVFEGQDPNEVYETVNNDVDIEPGDKAYLSAWPVDQDLNFSGERRRQEWVMDYLGIMDTTTTKGENLKDLRVFALKSNEEGAECSFGASGGVAITGSGDQIGTLAVFNEFVPDTWHESIEDADAARRHYEDLFGVDLSGYTTICAFDTKPSRDEMEILDVRIRKDHEVGAEVSEFEALFGRAMDDFNNVLIRKTFLNGRIENPSQKGGPGTSPYVENPILYIDESGSSLLYWRDDSAKSGFGYSYIEPGFEVGVSVYTVFDEDSPALLLRHTNGELALQVDEGFGYLDSEGNVVAGTVDEPFMDANTWNLNIGSDGSLGISKNEK